MSAPRRARLRNVMFGEPGYIQTSPVVLGPHGAVSFEDRSHGRHDMRMVLSHSATPEDCEPTSDPCPYLDGMPCWGDGASVGVDFVDEAVAGVFDDEDRTFALLEQKYHDWIERTP